MVGTFCSMEISGVMTKKSMSYLILKGFYGLFSSTGLVGLLYHDEAKIMALIWSSWDR